MDRASAGSGLMRAIVFSAHPWGGPFRLGAHQLALALARAAFEVLFVTAPLSPPHAAAALVLGHVRLRWREYFSPPRHDRIRVLTPFTLKPLSARWGADRAENLRQWPAHTIPDLEAEIARLGFLEADLAIMDGPLHLAAAQKIRPRKLVLRVFDRFSHMPGMSPAQMDLAKAAARASDLVIYSARALHDDVTALGPRRALFLPNGVDAAHYAHDAPAPTAYNAIASPRAVYVGQTGALFDAQLLARLAGEHAGVNFVVVGPHSPATASFRGIANIHHLGPINWNDLPPYLQHANVGLIPFAVKRFPEYAAAVHPLKLYEYLASGIPTVASRWDELEGLAMPGLTLADAEDFSAALDEALASPVDRDALRRFAATASWDSRLEQLRAALS